MNAKEESVWPKPAELTGAEPCVSHLSYVSLQVAAREFEMRFGRRIRFKRNLAAVISKQFLFSPTQESAEASLRAALAANGLRLISGAAHDLLIER